MSIYRVEVTFVEPMLGGAPLNGEIYKNYIATKKGVESPADPLTDGEIGEELASLPEGDKGVTGFHRDEQGNPIVYDYTWKGYFKEAVSHLRTIPTTESKGLTSYKKKIDGLLFVYPRRIPLILSGPITLNQRPLRAETMQGPRITLACSEQVPAGTRVTFELVSLSDSILSEELLREWMDYGAIKGFGQWRNASWGRLEYTMTRTTTPEFAPKIAWAA